ncbi:MAG TPA: hypothetical protein VIA10_01795 [Gaiellaceae bacterium]|jgi:hypothetical protein
MLLRRRKRNRVAARAERILLNILAAVWLTRRFARHLRPAR